MHTCITVRGRRSFYKAAEQQLVEHGFLVLQLQVKQFG